MASNVEGKDFLAGLKIAINSAIRGQAERDFDAFIEELKKRKEQVVAGIVLNMSEMVRYDVSGRTLLIEILKTEKK
jgi:ABC-type transporter Mla MlaB component